MRLWHYKLIPFLPKSQLLAQWRELNSIYEKEDDHILINYIYDSLKVDFAIYSLIVIKEFEKRGYKIKSYKKFEKYFDCKIKDCKSIKLHDLNLINIYSKYHNKRYLKQCFYNLQEKYDRGQKDFSANEYYKIVDYLEKNFNFKNLDED